MNTTHANIRAQQRGIPPIVVDLLFQFGQRAHDHRGGEVIYFDKQSRKKIETYAGGLLGKLNQHLDSYAVVADGKIITLGIRRKKINN